MFSTSYEIRGQRIATNDDLAGVRVLIVEVRDSSGVRQEPANWGSLRISCGDLVLDSDGQREAMEATFGYGASPQAMEQPGGQDTGVWVWQIPDGTTGTPVVEADWLRSMVGGHLTLIGH